MGNFWQIMTALGTGDAANQARKAAKEAEKIRELQTKRNEMAEQEMQESERRHQEMMELQEEQLKVSAMTGSQKLAYQKQKAKEAELQQKMQELIKFDPDDPAVQKALSVSLNKGKFSTAMLQTYLGRSHSFVSGLADWFGEIGIIGPENGNKPRDVLINSMDEFKPKIEEYVKQKLGK